MKVTLFVLFSAMTMSLVSAGPLVERQGYCDMDFTPNQGNDATVKCGPMQDLPCVYVTGGGQLISSPNKALVCSKNHSLCQYPKYMEMTVQCPQGIITVQAAGKQFTYQNHAYGSADAYFISQKCQDHPQKGYSTYTGDTLYVDCHM